MYVPHSLFAALPYPETGHACGSVKPLLQIPQQSAEYSWRIVVAICRRDQTRKDISFRVRIEILEVVHTPELSSCRRSPTWKQINRKQAGALNQVLQMNLIYRVNCFKKFPSAKEYLTLFFFNHLMSETNNIIIISSSIWFGKNVGK